MNDNDNVKIIDDDKQTIDELDAMFSGGEKNDKSKEKSYDTGNKVLVKTNNHNISTGSDENGYGSVLGVVLVIVSVSFIIAALLIRMMS